MGMTKRISVSKRRQMTIPKEFYDELGISNEVLCQMIDRALIIKPIKTDVDFSEEILNDLIMKDMKLVKNY